jgi:glycosyltransferase involved in cell wall biosynthesis
MGIRSSAAPRMAETPFVSVVIPHYRDLKGLDRCLTALQAQTYDPQRVEIIVADNASPEGAEAVAAAIQGRAKLVVVTDRGAGPARNGGVAISTAPVLAFTDSDCVPEPQWLATGVAALDRFEVVGGRVKVLVEDPARMTPEEAFESVFAFDFKTYIEKKGFTGAGNLFCSRETFDQVGAFRVGLSEDVEWSRRATATGARLGYEPQAVVGHPARSNWGDLRNKWKRLNFETFGLMAGQPRRRSRWLARSLLLPASAVAHTPKVLMSPELPGVREKLGALGVLYRLRLWRMVDAIRMLQAT